MPAGRQGAAKRGRGMVEGWTECASSWAGVLLNLAISVLAFVLRFAHAIRALY